MSWGGHILKKFLSGSVLVLLLTVPLKHVVSAPIIHVIEKKGVLKKGTSRRLLEVGKQLVASGPGPDGQKVGLIRWCPRQLCGTKVINYKSDRTQWVGNVQIKNCFTRGRQTTLYTSKLVFAFFSIEMNVHINLDSHTLI